MPAKLETRMEDVVVPRRRLSVAEYHCIAEAGVLTEDDRVELIEGELIEMAPIGSRHAFSVDCFARILQQQIPARAWLRIQNPITLGGETEPQPDFAIVKAGRYGEAHPGPADILLIIEVAESSVVYDRRAKVPLYARYGIPEVWVVDLAEGTIEAYRQPGAEGYSQIQRFTRDTVAIPAGITGIRVPVAEILP
jgi:Uma2 family endonuclease